MAHAGGEQADQHLAATGWLELKLEHPLRFTDLCEHGRGSATDFHCLTLRNSRLFRRHGRGAADVCLA